MDFKQAAAAQDAVNAVDSQLGRNNSIMGHVAPAYLIVLVDWPWGPPLVAIIVEVGVLPQMGLLVNHSHCKESSKKLEKNTQCCTEVLIQQKGNAPLLPLPCTNAQLKKHPKKGWVKYIRKKTRLQIAHVYAVTTCTRI